MSNVKTLVAQAYASLQSEGNEFGTDAKDKIGRYLIESLSLMETKTGKTSHKTASRTKTNAATSKPLSAESSRTRKREVAGEVSVRERVLELGFKRPSRLDVDGNNVWKDKLALAGLLFVRIIQTLTNDDPGYSMRQVGNEVKPLRFATPQNEPHLDRAIFAVMAANCYVPTDANGRALGFETTRDLIEALIKSEPTKEAIIDAVNKLPVS